MNSLLQALKTWRENYYVSSALAALGKPVSQMFGFFSDEIQKKIRKNGVAVTLPNGKVLRVARDSGVWLASCLYWHGWEGYEKTTSRTLRFFLTKPTPLLMLVLTW